MALMKIIDSNLKSYIDQIHWPTDTQKWQVVMYAYTMFDTIIFLQCGHRWKWAYPNPAKQPGTERKYSFKSFIPASLWSASKYSYERVYTVSNMHNININSTSLLICHLSFWIVTTFNSFIQSIIVDQWLCLQWICDIFN